jgi:hypothetical protein
MRLPRLAPVILLVAALAVPVVGAPLAFAGEDSVTALGFSNFGQMVIDGPRSQVILSEGAGGSDIVFADFDGNITGTITGLSGPSGMVRVGTTLYVVENDSGEITPIDLTNNTVGTVVATSTDPWYMLGYANNRLWADANPGLDRINPGTGAVTTLTGADFPAGFSDFATDPTDTTELSVLTYEGGTPTLRIYDVSTAPPTLVRSATVSGVWDLRYGPDGTQLYLPSGSGANEYATSDLSLTHSYDLGSGTDHAVDVVDVGGQGFVGGGGDNNQHVEVYEEQANSTTNDVSIPSTGYSSTLMRRGARFSPSGDRLFAVVSGGGLFLAVFDDPTLPGSTTTLSAPGRVTFGDPVHLTGSLTYADSAAVAAGETIEIWQGIENQASVMVGTTTTALGGAWSFDQPTDSTEVNKSLHFTAVFPGNASHRTSTSALDTTEVGKIRPNLRLRTSKSKITVGDRVQIGVHLQMDPTINHHVSIYVTYGSGSDRIATITVDNKGNGSIRQAPIHNAEYWAVSTHDKTHDAARSNHEKVKVRAKVTTSLSRYYATKSGVRLYHKGTNPLYKIKVAPNSTGLTVGVALQKKTSSGWKTIGSAGFKLRRGSTITLAINGGSLARNITYRTIAFFKSNRNALGVSKWEYFRFT